MVLFYFSCSNLCEEGRSCDDLNTPIAEYVDDDDDDESDVYPFL